MAITVGNTSSSVDDASGTTRSWSHDNNGSVFVVTVQYQTSASGVPSSVTYDGTSMTLGRQSALVSGGSSVYYLVGASSGVNTVVITFTSSVNTGASGISLVDAKGFHADAAGPSTNSTTSSLTVAFPDGGVVVDALLILDETINATSWGANQTAYVNLLSTGTPLPATGSHSSYNTTDGDMSWVLASSSVHTQAAVSFEPEPPATDTGFLTIL